MHKYMGIDYIQRLVELILWLVILMFVFPQAGRTASLLSAPDPVAILIDEGLRNNQALQSMRMKIEGSKERAKAAGTLADPMIGIAVANLPVDSFAFDEQAMTQKQLFISQRFPWFGKLRLKERYVALSVIRQEALLTEKELELAKAIALASYELGFIDQNRIINTRLSQMVQQTLKIAEARYTTGRGRQQDVFQAQVELSKLADEKIMLEKMHRMQKDRIHALLNRRQPLEIALSAPLKPFDEMPDSSTLTATALMHNPMVRLKQTDIDLAKTSLELAHKNYWPDVDVKLSYGQRDAIDGNDMPDFFSAAVTMNIPLWQNRKQDRLVAADDALHTAAVKSYKELIDSLPYRVDALKADIDDTIRSYELYQKTLLVQARQWARSALADYEVGKVTFDIMIKAQTRLLQFELKAERYLHDMYKKRAELEAVIGGPISRSALDASAKTIETKSHRLSTKGHE